MNLFPTDLRSVIDRLRKGRQHNSYGAMGYDGPMIADGLEAVDRRQDDVEKRVRALEGSLDQPTEDRKAMHARAKHLLDFIGHHEAPEGYAQVYGGSRLWPEKPITSMTINEVLAWQDASVREGSRSSAAGQYQIIRKTLRGLVRKLGLTGGELFDPAMQDRLAATLLDWRGWERYTQGRVSETWFGNNVAAEWASMPMLSGPKKGRSRYDGDGLNSALCTVEEYRKAIRGFA